MCVGGVGYKNVSDLLVANRLPVCTGERSRMSVSYHLSISPDILHVTR